MHVTFAYKRRKLRNSVTLLSEDNDMRSMKRGRDFDSSPNSECISLEDHNHCVKGILVLPVNTSISLQSHHHKPIDVLASQMDDTRDPMLLLNYAVGQKHPTNKVQKLTLECVSDGCSSSKSNVEWASSLVDIEVEYGGKHSFSSHLAVEPSGKHVSAQDVCVPVLVTHDQSGNCLPRDDCTSVDALGGNDGISCLSCKVCGLVDNPLKMLICDLCEEAFHLSCCNAKKLPVDEWYCCPCLRKKPKVLPDTPSGKFLHVMSEKQRRILQKKLGPILCMLEDKEQYTSGVRIGEDYQAEVPEWTGPISDGEDCFCTSIELDTAEWASLNGWSLNRSSRSSSIDNWLQCREMIYNETDENNEGVLCGKLRR